jgi:hypothetical protein
MLYRQALSSRQIRSLDIDIVDWYMTHVPDMETRLRSMVRGADCFDLAYEDMFGPELSIDQRVAKFAEVLEFLGFASAYGSWDRATVEYLLSPDRRLNRQDTLARIPNVAAIASRYPEYRLT